ncbi:methyl-accepting chemotaxis protein [Clostridiaceae bacterium 14S0207]|nr:methyl-accepting chemotaxis protein [Clostridiaceae bacterium 14S0207]
MKLLKNLKISSKLITSFLVIALLMMFIGGFGVLGINKIDKSANGLYYDNIIGISSINDLNKNFLTIYSNLQMLSHITTKEELKNLMQENEQITKRSDEYIKLYKTGITKDEDKKLMNELEEKIKVYRSIRKEYTEICFSKNKSQASKKFGALKQAKDDVLKVLDNLVDLNNKWAEDAISANKSIFTSSITAIITIFIISTILLIICAILLIKSIINPLNKIKEFAYRLSQYDFSTKIDISEKNEFGQTSEALNKAQDNVNTLIKSVINSTQDMSASSEELSATVEEMTSKLENINESTKKINVGVQETSATAQELSASVEEVDSSVSILSDKALYGSNNAIEIKERAVTVEQNSKEAVENTNKIYMDMEKEILKDIEKGKVVSEIKVMADTISSIAKQINLLSLNAAIEAARAGEHGKGFAVVADEVRKLAEQSAQAVENVESTIEEVQVSFGNLSRNSNELLDFMNNNVIKQFENFIKAGEEYENDGIFVSNMSEELASMTQEITGTIEQVNEAVQNMAEMAQNSSENLNEIQDSVNESTQAMEQVACTSQDQAELAQKLNEIVSKFKI